MSNTIPYAAKFFMLARERYNILLRRRAGQKWPWTIDTHLQTWRFTNIFREDDRTMTWFRENVRDPLSINWREGADHDERVKLVESTVIFRWFNRISTGEIIKDLLLTDGWDSKEAYRRLKGEDPIFTGAYIIIGVPGQSKLEGVLEAIDDARPYLPRMVQHWTIGSCIRCGGWNNWEQPCPKNPAPDRIHLLRTSITLEEVWEDLKTIPYIGGFTGHEIVQDLRYTPILENATDIMTWGNLGPGAIRGISWLVYGHGDGYNNSVSQQKLMLKLMVELLEMSRQEEYWPQAWPKWEMHQVEFLLCETAKYFRSLNGHRQKRRYEHP